MVNKNKKENKAKALHFLRYLTYSVSFFGISYGIAIFIYFYFRINRDLSWIFIIPIILGVLLILKTSHNIAKEQSSNNQNEIQFPGLW